MYPPSEGWKLLETTWDLLRSWPESPSWRKKNGPIAGTKSGTEIAPRLHPNVRQICWWSGKKNSVHNSWKHLFVDAISLGRQMDPSFAENMPTKWSLDRENLYEWTANRGYGSNDVRYPTIGQLETVSMKYGKKIRIHRDFLGKFPVSGCQPFSTTHCHGDPSFCSIESRPDLQGISDLSTE